MITSSRYEPVYFSRSHAWKNDINHTDEQYVKMVKDIEIFDKMWSQFLDDLKAKGLAQMTVRQGMIMWLTTQAKVDCELEDFDSKVRKDTDAYLREHSGVQFG